MTTSSRGEWGVGGSAFLNSVPDMPGWVGGSLGAAKQNLHPRPAHFVEECDGEACFAYGAGGSRHRFFSKVTPACLLLRVGTSPQPEGGREGSLWQERLGI